MAAELRQPETNESIRSIASDYKYGFSDTEDYVFKSGRGLTEEIVRRISEMKNEPEWMLKFRLRALDIFRKKPMPTWGNCKLLNDIDFDNIFYYIKPSERGEKNWDEVPDGIKNTFDRLGIPEAERKFWPASPLNMNRKWSITPFAKTLEKQGVIFLDMDSGLREHGDIVREHFATVIPAADNKFSALNSAVWSGGSFIWVPPGVKIEIPLQAYFRINAENMGQFEAHLDHRRTR